MSVIPSSDFVVWLEATAPRARRPVQFLRVSVPTGRHANPDRNPGRVTGQSGSGLIWQAEPAVRPRAPGDQLETLRSPGQISWRGVAVAALLVALASVRLDRRGTGWRFFSDPRATPAASEGEFGVASCSGRQPAARMSIIAAATATGRSSCTGLAFGPEAPASSPASAASPAKALCRRRAARLQGAGLQPQPATSFLR